MILFEKFYYNFIIFKLYAIYRLSLIFVQGLLNKDTEKIDKSSEILVSFTLKRNKIS